MTELVWLTEERTYGWLINLGAYFSLIRFEKDGLVQEILIENDEWEYTEGIEYESE